MSSRLASSFARNVRRAARSNFHSNGRGSRVLSSLVQPQLLLDLLQAGEVVWGQRLSLDDREIDLYLIAPTGMEAVALSF
jgi:hypothetical protein